MKTILVVLDGGLIQDVVGVPDGVRVVVRDYDVEGTDLEDYVEDEMLFKVGGSLCTQVEWGSDPKGPADISDATLVTSLEECK